MRVVKNIVMCLVSAVVLMAILFSCVQKRQFSENTGSVISNNDGDRQSVTADTLAKPSVRPEDKLITGEDALEYMEESPFADKYSDGILPQMAKDVPEYAIRLLQSTHDGFIVVDKNRMRVIKYDKYGVEQESYKMACAKNYGTKHKRRDSRTPEGFFSVKKVHNSTEWQFVDDDGHKSDKKGEFGPRFIRLNIPVTTQIGIHGTSAPWSLGGRRSHGCIRIHNDNIMKLVEMVDSGMPVIVSPGRKDMLVNFEEGYDVPAVSTVKGKPHLTIEEIQSANVKKKETATDTLGSTGVEIEIPKDSTHKTEQKIDSVAVDVEKMKNDSVNRENELKNL